MVSIESTDNTNAVILFSYNPEIDKEILKKAVKMGKATDIEDFLKKEYIKQIQSHLNRLGQKLNVKSETKSNTDFQAVQSNIEHQCSKNSENICKVIRLIQEGKYIDQWETKSLYENQILEIMKIPIYLPWTCPYVLSGIAVLLVLIPEKIIFVPEELIAMSRRRNETKFLGKNLLQYMDCYQRFYNKSHETDHSYKGQFSSKLGLDFKDIPNNKHGDLWNFFLMYDFIKKISFTRKKQDEGAIHGGSSLLDCISFIYSGFLESSSTLQYNKDSEHSKEETSEWCSTLRYNNDMLRLMLFKTVIYFRMTGMQQEEIHQYVSLMGTFRRHLRLELEQIAIQSKAIFLWNPFRGDLAYRCMDQIVADVDSAIEKSSVFKVQKNAIDYCVLWRILAYENLSRLENYIDDNRQRFITENPDHGMEETKFVFSSFFKDIDEINKGMDVETWKAFKEKYKSDIIWGSHTSEKLWGKFWGIAIKNILFQNPQRFNFNFATMGISEIPKSPTAGWYNQHGIAFKSCRVDEILPMMLLVDRAYREYYPNKATTDGKNVRYLYQKMDNIRAHWMEHGLLDEIKRQCASIKQSLDLAQNPHMMFCEKLFEYYWLRGKEAVFIKSDNYQTVLKQMSNIHDNFEMVLSGISNAAKYALYHN